VSPRFTLDQNDSPASAGVSAGRCGGADDCGGSERVGSAVEGGGDTALAV